MSLFKASRVLSVVVMFGLLCQLSVSTADFTYASNQTVNPSKQTNKQAFFLYNISIGMSAGDVIKKLGQPSRKDPSQIGVEWWIYNKDLNNYLQVGMQNGRVVTLFTNGVRVRVNGVGIGSTTSVLAKHLGLPKTSLAITPDLTINNNTLNNRPSYLINHLIYTFSIDKLDGNKVNGIRISTADHFASIALDLMYPISYYRLPALPRLTQEQWKKVNTAYEREDLDLTNIARKRAGLPPLTWDNHAANVARSHSVDMTDHRYFSHNSPTVGSPFDRLERAGISFSYAGENIAAGQLDMIEAHLAWMNSAGHRKNILNKHFTKIGVGVNLQKGQRMYTEDFVTPW